MRHDPPKCPHGTSQVAHNVLLDIRSGEHYCLTCLNDPPPPEEPAG
jgi:hypothetical protein